MKTTIIISILTLAAILGTYHLYSSSSNPDYQVEVEDENVLNMRRFFKKWGKKAHRFHQVYNQVNQQIDRLQFSIEDENDIPEIVTYGINLEINVSEQDSNYGIEEAHQNIKLSAQCDVQTIYDEDLNVFDIAVSYTKVDKHDVKLQEEENQDEEDNYDYQDTDNGFIEEVIEVEREEQYEVEQNEDQFFLLQVNADSGEILSLQIESAYEEDQIVTYATQQLINDIFPELRKDSFQNGNIEDDNLGAAKVNYTTENIDDQTIAISKEYDSKDYIKLEVPDLEIPESDFERTVLINKETGLVTEGQTDYKFTLGENTEEAKLRSTDGNFDGEIEVEALGLISGEMKSQFWIVKPSERDTQIAAEMFRYRQEPVFEPKKLNKEMKAEIEYGTGESEEFELVDINEPDEVIIVNDNEEINSSHSDIFVDNVHGNHNKNDIYYDTSYDTSLESSYNDGEEFQLQKLQSNGRRTFQQVNKLAGTRILGKSIGLDFVYTGYTEVSTLALKIRVGSRYISTILQKTLKNCKPSHNSRITTKGITFFKATFPVLGIVVIPVSAQGKISYGYTTSVKTAPRFCELSVVPQFKASIYGDGKVSILGVISAGVYAQGHILDTKLILKATTQQGKSSLSLTGVFHAFGFEMGVTYDRIRCSLKNLRESQQQQQLELPYQEQEQEKLQFRRLFKKVKKVVRRVSHVAKKTAHRAYHNAKKFVKKFTKICSKTPGYIQIAKFSTGRQRKNIWSISVPYGI